MSNLGLYQAMTTVAKKVGGPLALAGITALSGYAILRTGEAGVKTIVKKRKKTSKEKLYADTIFTVDTDSTDKQGLSFKKGDKFRVLEFDEDAILIELIGNDNNPYFVSGTFLKTISDFK